jgi:hypothetical protein
VLTLLARGCSSPDIARQLYLSPKTVRNHVSAGMDCTPPSAITPANIATVSIDFTRRGSRGELPVLDADEAITPAGAARA